ncbi:MAG TPA: hypothetical protein VFP84_14200 [Kofleriaceae bacterium]|nr:hypothetical protein [Kofleriaceae bacterium]
MNRGSLVARLAPALVALAGVSCGGNADVALNQLNLNQPVDISFACYGGLRVASGTTETSAQPTASCDFRSAERPDPLTSTEPRPPGQEDVGTSVVSPVSWYAFILQSSSGTVAIAQWTTVPASGFTGLGDVLVLDADPLTPAKNAISVGEDPIGIETDKTGCFEVTANAGSCDFSVLDVGTAVLAATTGVGTQVKVNRLPITTPNGTPVYAKPAAMVGEPSLSVQQLGQECKAAPQGLAYVAFPGCNMVAGVDLSSGTAGKITSMITFDAAGAPTVLSDPAAIETAAAACPVECTNTGHPVALAKTGVRPVALSYGYDVPSNTRKLAIGAENSPKVTVVNLTSTAETVQNGPDPAQPPAQVELAPSSPVTTPAQTGTFGVTQVALSSRIGMGGTAGDPFPVSDTVAPGGVGQYVYAVATDATVRVIDVLGANNTPVGTPNECDTQIDPRAIEGTSVATSVPLLQCIPVGFKPASSPTPLPRRPGVRGPGIELPKKQVPLSVAFVRPPAVYSKDANNMDVQVRPANAPTNLVGTFGVITSVSGQTYLVNVDDDNNVAGTDQFVPSQPQLTEPAEIMAHQLRDNVQTRDVNARVQTNPGSGSGSGSVTYQPSCVDLGVVEVGGPRASSPPTLDATLGATAAAKLAELPSFPQERCTASDAPNGVPVSELQLAASPATRARVFPDLKSLPLDESWIATWEGRLSNDGTSLDNLSLDGPPIRQGNFVIDSTAQARLDDASNPFCGMGVEPYDIVQFRGCNPNNGDLDCPSNYKCYVHADTAVQVEGVAQGSCMLKTEADRLATACRDYLISLRRFTVRKATTGELVLMPRKHELDATPLDGCTDDAQCQAYADAAEQTHHDVFDANTKDPHSWACMLDDTRAPLAGDPAKKRCVQTCTVRAGADRDDDCDVGSLCVGEVGGKGVCMEGVIPPQSCVNAPQRFDVRGHEAFVVIGDVTGYTHAIVAEGGKVGAACVKDPNADPFAISRIPLTAPACAGDPVTGEVSPGVIEPSPCSTTVTTTETTLTYPTPGSCANPTTTLADRQARAIRIHKPGLTLTMIDPTYPGDKACPLDRGGAPGLPPGSQIPLTFSGLNLKFHITAGYNPLTLQSTAGAFNPVLPVKVVAGPGGSIWVLDAGDFLSQTIDQASTLGAVYRVESVSLSIANLIQ